MAFPYVSASEEEKLENSLVSGFSKACGDSLEIGDVAFLGSCSMEGANLESAAVRSIQVTTNPCSNAYYGILGCYDDLILSSLS